MLRMIKPFAAFALLLGLGLATASVRAATPSAPEFTQSLPSQWINSPPLTLAALHGRPVLVEFWTFDCSNCRNTLPWLKSAVARYVPRGLAVVGVHTPELAREREPANVRRATAQLGITWPVMLDADFGYWNAMGNRYWPAFYLLDANGRVVAQHFGELHTGQRDAVAFEARIAALLSTR